jgi:uncharacterized protein
MQLDLTRLQGSRAHVERSYDAGAFGAQADDCRVAGPVTLVLDVEKAGQEVVLEGRAAARLELACSRCLEPFAWPVDAAFRLRYLPQTANRGAEEQEVDEAALEVAFYEGEAIDLGQLLREQFYLALPMKPLCRPDCRGLCPACGANRNAASCGCDARWEDPRLAPLRRLAGPSSPTDES